MDNATKNTDRELWREKEGDFYSPSIHVTASGAIGINVGGMVVVRTLCQWHALALANSDSTDSADRGLISELDSLPPKAMRSTDFDRNQKMNLIIGVSTNIMTALGMGWKRVVAPLCNTGGDYGAVKAMWEEAYLEACKRIEQLKEAKEPERQQNPDSGTITCDNVKGN